MLKTPLRFGRLLLVVARVVDVLVVGAVLAGGLAAPAVAVADFAVEPASRIEAARREYDAVPRDGEARERWRTVAEGLDTWLAGVDALAAQAWSRSPAPGEPPVDDGLWRAFLALREKHDRFAKPLAELIAVSRSTAIREREAAQAAARRDVTLVAVLVLLGSGATVAVGLWLARRADRVVATLRAQAGALHEAVEAGRLDVRGDPAAVEVDFRPVVDGMNATMDAFARPIAVTADYLTRISKGEVPPRITDRYEGDFNATKDALNRCIDAVNALVEDAAGLARAGVEGRLQARADVSRHQGHFRKVVQGVNDTLDAVLVPIAAAAACVDGIAKGNMPPPMSGEYRGDFAALRDNVNACIASLAGVLEQTIAATRAQDGGDIDAYVPEDRFVGVYRELAAGVNAGIRIHVLNILKILELLKSYAEGDFAPQLERLKGKQIIANERLDLLRENLRGISAEIVALSHAAAAGRLSARADTSKFRGGWHALASGVNATLDAVVAPVEEASAVLVQLADRDLTARVNGDYQGDHARIKHAVNGTADALHQAVAQVATSADQVSSAAAQIAASSQSVASGASEQAASLEETSSSIDSVAGMTRAASDHARQAHALVQGTRDAATAGSAAVDQMQGAMARIKASSEGTSQIIKDVSEIAFQTNLLALNAAVEAARAGDAGRGFAVVAEEVRSLALRAKEAATKTEELIRQSVKEANEGEQTARHVAGKLEEIAGGVTKVTAIVSEIAASASEQASGIDQVTKAVAEMDKVTQQNAASAEESSSAASELSGQAQELAAMVASFKLEHAAARKLAPFAAPRRPAAKPASPGAARPALPAKPRNGAGAHHDPFPMDDDVAIPRDF
jgi:methyl-accepting chemotaxis protein